MLQNDSVSAPRDFQQVRQTKHEIRCSRAPQMTRGRTNIADDVLEVISMTYHTTTTVLRPFFRDHPGEPVPEENFWILWCKGLTEADRPTIQLGATPSGLTNAHLHHPPIFYMPIRHRLSAVFWVIERTGCLSM